MYRFCPLPFRFDPHRLHADLAKAESLGWLPHFVTGNYEGDWSVIPLRSVGGQPEHMVSDIGVAAEDYRDTPILAACEYFQDVLAEFACPLTSVRLMKLAPGSRIKEHRDLDLTFGRGTVRLHIPVTTNPQVEFFIENERVIMGEGECWYIDATLPHRLANLGTTNRVHIVFDCQVNDWLAAHFEASGYQPKVLDFFEARNLRRNDAPKVIAALRAMNDATSLRLADEMEAALETVAA